MNLIRKNSPNHYNGRNGWKADMIVFHQTGGNTVTPALNWYLNPSSNVSPNYLIDKNGDVYQLVDLDNAAWCNGTNNTIGDKLYCGKSLSEIVKQRKTNANYYTYSIEFVHCQWGNITKAQQNAAIALIKEVIIPHMRSKGVKPQIDRKHIVGHSDIAPIARPNGSCPGRKFDFQKIIDAINETENNPDRFIFPIKVGDKVNIKTSATTYAGSCTKIPEVYKGSSRSYTVTKVSEQKSLLKELFSWVLNKDLEIVKEKK